MIDSPEISPLAENHSLNVSSRASRIAMVGNGVAALAALSVFYAEGLRRAEVTVYGDQSDPFANLRRYSRAINQDRMRSESGGHFFPTDFPGLALLDSIQHHTPRPLWRSLFDHYQPRLEDLLRHGDAIARVVKSRREFVRARVERIAYSPRSQFVLYDRAGNELGSAQSVLLALGHPGLRWTPTLLPWCNHPRVAHAYQAKRYVAGESVLVIGAGMAATHEWLAALRAGCRVLALSRHPLHQQPLNAPRCDFSARGLDKFRARARRPRHDYLDEVASGTFPPRRDWETELTRARRAGDWRSIVAELVSIEQHRDELIARLSSGEAVIVQRIVAATGFVPDMSAHPLIAQLVHDYALPFERGRLLVRDDFTVPTLGSEGARLAVIGNLARWALPVADTFAGMKYVARRLCHTFGLETTARARFNFTLALVRAQF